MEPWIYIIIFLALLGWAETASHGQLSAFLITGGQSCMALGCGLMVLIVLLVSCGIFIL